MTEQRQLYGFYVVGEVEAFGTLCYVSDDYDGLVEQAEKQNEYMQQRQYEVRPVDSPPKRGVQDA